MKLTSSLKALFVVAVTSLFCGCQSNQNLEVKPIISVSIAPQKYFVETIAAQHFEINTVLPAGSNPENYNPTPMQLKKLTKSIMYIRIGNLAFEETWINKITAQNPKIKDVNLSEGLNLIQEEDKHDHAGTDPHTWMSPKNVKKMSQVIAQSLILISPADSLFFMQNLAHFNHELEKLDSLISSQLIPLPHRTFLIFHPALSYFAKDYGLVQESIEHEGKEPGPAHLKNLIYLASEQDIKAIFIQKQFDISSANAMARQLDVSIIQIDPLAENWMEEINYITTQLVTVLQ